PFSLPVAAGRPSRHPPREPVPPEVRWCEPEQPPPITTATINGAAVERGLAWRAYGAAAPSVPATATAGGVAAPSGTAAGGLSGVAVPAGATPTAASPTMPRL